MTVRRYVEIVCDWPGCARCGRGYHIGVGALRDVLLSRGWRHLRVLRQEFCGPPSSPADVNDVNDGSGPPGGHAAMLDGHDCVPRYPTRRHEAGMWRPACACGWVNEHRVNNVAACWQVWLEVHVHQDVCGLPAPVVEKPPTADPGDDFLTADLGMKIEELEMTTRTYNCLKREGVDTVGELKARTEADLRDYRNFGTKCIDEVKVKLAGMGFHLADLPTRPASATGDAVAPPGFVLAGGDTVSIRRHHLAWQSRMHPDDVSGGLRGDSMCGYQVGDQTDVDYRRISRNLNTVDLHTLPLCGRCGLLFAATQVALAVESQAGGVARPAAPALAGQTRA